MFCDENQWKLSHIYNTQRGEDSSSDTLDKKASAGKFKICSSSIN